MLFCTASFLSYTDIPLKSRQGLSLGSLLHYQAESLKSIAQGNALWHLPASYHSG